MKRFVCFLLAMILIMGMVPATAVTASAASERTTSDKAINILKEYEGFSAKVYSSGGKYYVGYGTQIDASKKDNYPNGISKDDALVLLKKHVEKTVDEALNTFAAKNNLNLTQYQHDALALFSYSYGTAWLNGNGPLRTAVLQGKSGNEFINAIAQSYGGDPSADNFKGQINRRLSEANMYLNNSYGFYAPSNFTYVVLDLNGNEKADANDEVIAYNSVTSVTMAKTPADYGHSATGSFLGWYLYDGKVDGAVNGQAITTLSADTAGKLLVAKYDDGTDNEASNFGNANYSIYAASLPSLYVFNTTYSKAQMQQYKDSMDEKAKGNLYLGTIFKVDTEIMVDGVKWVRGIGAGYNKNGVYVTNLEGWVYMGELPTAGTATNTVLATAKVTTNSLIVREGATQNSKETGKVLNKGTTVNIYEFRVEATNTGNKTWGRVNVDGVGGWINLVYTDVTEVTDKTGTVEGKTGVIVNAEEVNVRSEAKIVNSPSNVITTLKKGTQVTVLKTEMNGAAQWGKVRWSGLKDGYTEGWVYMYHVEVAGFEHSNSTGSAGGVSSRILYTGVVTSNINLNVRQYADIYAPRVNSLPTGTRVNVYELASSRNMQWGRIGDGQWVCTSYLNMTAVNNTTNSGSNAEGTTSIQGTVTTTTLNVLKNYNSNSEKVGELKKGDVVTILEKNTETTETGSRIWGRIDKNGVKGWINLAYVDLKTVTTVAPGTGTTGTTSATPIPAIISDCVSVNVRQAAGVYSTPITKLNNGTSVTVYEQITYANAPWARIKWNNGANEGWVCMYYVTLNAGTGSSNTDSNGILNGTNSNTISATGYVSNAYLNVRSGAGLGFAQIGTLNQGAKVTLFEQAVADGLIWGRISYNNAPGWVCMSYITVENASSTGKGVMGTVARCFSHVNVRSAPGTNNALVSTISVGSRVEVFETRSHGAGLWGRVPQGWVSMEYILLDSELPEGTVLDATTAPTETTAATVPTVTINKDNEVAYVINGTVLADPLNVRNDADVDSDKIGSVKKDMPIQILAVKNNGAELWGRIDQYATAGWVNLEYVKYEVKGFINTDNQAVYADANTSSIVKGNLIVNTPVTIMKLTLNGETVYGWYQDSATGLSGWIPMGRISKDPVVILPTYKNTTDAVKGAGIDVQGRTNAAITAYTATNSGKEAFYLASGVTVYIGEIDLEAGTVWGLVKANGVEGWINLNAVTYVFSGSAAATKLNVRTSKDASSDTNIIGRVNDPDAATTPETNDTAKADLSICELGFDANGALWGKLTGFAADSTEAVFNGGWIKMSNVTTVINIQTK